MIAHIVAVAKNRVIGKGNTLPWILPDDMKFFKQTTMGHHVVMGRKNYESIPVKFKPLANRVNIILTRTPDPITVFTEAYYNGCFFYNSIQDALEFGKVCGKDTFIIGGGEIYQQSIDLVDKLYVTEIDAEVEGDVFYPEIDKTIWIEAQRVHHPIDARHQYAFDFVIYNRALF
jgi:dihydrofolate reductase